MKGIEEILESNKCKSEWILEIDADEHISNKLRNRDNYEARLTENH